MKGQIFHNVIIISKFTRFYHFKAAKTLKKLQMKQKQIVDCSEPIHPSPVSVSICVCIIRFYITQMNVMYTTSTCINTIRVARC